MKREIFVRNIIHLPDFNPLGITWNEICGFLPDVGNLFQEGIVLFVTCTFPSDVASSHLQYRSHHSNMALKAWVCKTSKKAKPWFRNQRGEWNENNGSRGVARLTSNLSLKLGLGPNTGKDEKTETRFVRNCAGGRPPLPPLSIMQSIMQCASCNVQRTLVDRLKNSEKHSNLEKYVKYFKIKKICKI